MFFFTRMQACTNHIKVVLTYKSAFALLFAAYECSHIRNRRINI